MTQYTDPNGDTRSASIMLEDFVAREHWEPILSNVLWIGMVLFGVGLLLGMPPARGLLLVYFTTLPLALMNGHLALRIGELGREDLAVPIARRALAALLLAGIALVAGRLMV